MSPLYLIVEIAGQRVALPAEHVESVVEVEAITPVPLAARHIAGLAALRSRVLTIIDSLASLEFGATPIGPTQRAAIVTVDGHLYGPLVDQVEDVIEHAAPARPVHVALAGGWLRTARGMIEVDGEALLLVDPVALVAGPVALAA